MTAIRPPAISANEAFRLDRASPLEFKFKLGTALKNVFESLLEDQASIGVVQAQVSRGYSLGASTTFSGQPSALDTLTIGSDVYQFLDGTTYTATSVAGYIAVLIGGSLAATGAALAAAINGTAKPLHPTLEDKNGGPAAGVGAVGVTAAFETDTLIVYGSTAPGSGVPSGGVSIALAKSGSNIGAWSYANLNLIGAAKADKKSVSGKITVQAAWVSAATGGTTVNLPIILGFTPTEVRFQVVDGEDVVQTIGNDSLAPDEGGLSFHLNADASSGTDLTAGDVIYFEAAG